jgi:hypothetical protein
MMTIEIKDTPEYQAIAAFYANRTAARSKVELMQHIDEGLLILNDLKASDEAKRAYCIHPIVQNNEKHDIETTEYVYSLAEVYRDKANAYLCRPETDYITSIEQLPGVLGDIPLDCLHMLIADKKQNQKDFRLHHKNTHPRSEQLEAYFILWLKYLENAVDDIMLDEIIDKARTIQGHDYGTKEQLERTYARALISTVWELAAMGRKPYSVTKGYDYNRGVAVGYETALRYFLHCARIKKEHL